MKSKKRFLKRRMRWSGTHQMMSVERPDRKFIVRDENDNIVSIRDERPDLSEENLPADDEFFFDEVFISHASDVSTPNAEIDKAVMLDAEGLTVVVLRPLATAAIARQRSSTGVPIEAYASPKTLAHDMVGLVDDGIQLIKKQLANYLELALADAMESAKKKTSVLDHIDPSFFDG